jgi:hypothetical protein
MDPRGASVCREQSSQQNIAVASPFLNGFKIASSVIVSELFSFGASIA